MENTIKPCPTCDKDVGELITIDISTGPAARYAYKICCSNCGTSTGNENSRSKSEVINNWNRLYISREISSKLLKEKMWDLWRNYRIEGMAPGEAFENAIAEVELFDELVNNFEAINTKN